MICHLQLFVKTWLKYIWTCSKSIDFWWLNMVYHDLVWSCWTMVPFNIHVLTCLNMVITWLKQVQTCSKTMFKHVWNMIKHVPIIKLSPWTPLSTENGSIFLQPSLLGPYYKWIAYHQIFRKKYRAMVEFYFLFIGHSKIIQACTWQNLQEAKTQISLCICAVWSVFPVCMSLL